jgi:hypothetical protein
MNGKINIVFGFIYLALTAALGPALLVPQIGEHAKAFDTAARAVGKVRQDIQEEFMNTQNPAQNIAPAVVGIFDYLKGERGQSSVAGGPHTHGNLEALLNIAAGLVLLTLAIPGNFKALLSLLFLAGAIFHSGMLYLGVIFGMGWAFKLTAIGAVSIIAALLLTGVAAFIGIKKAG